MKSRWKLALWVVSSLGMVGLIGAHAARAPGYDDNQLIKRSLPHFVGLH